MRLYLAFIVAVVLGFAWTEPTLAHGTATGKKRVLGFQFQGCVKPSRTIVEWAELHEYVYNGSKHNHRIGSGKTTVRRYMSNYDSRCDTYEWREEEVLRERWRGRCYLHWEEERYEDCMDRFWDNHDIQRREGDWWVFYDTYWATRRYRVLID